MISGKIFVLLVSIGFSLALTETEYNIIRFKVYDKIRADLETDKDRIQPTILRLSFHDCVSNSCDGCINIDNPENAGLSKAIDHLEEVYGTLGTEGIEISRADFWAIAGRAAAEYGMEGMPGHVDGNVDLDNFVSPFDLFKYGRVDCATSPYTSDIFEFPNPLMTHGEMINFFKHHFDGNLKKKHVVALIGAHTLGRCNEENSGYRGPWLQGNEKSTFDNKFFKIIANQSVEFIGDNTGKGTGLDAKPQYNYYNDKDSRGMMLNTDLEVAYDLTMDSVDYLATCNPIQSCELSSTYEYTVEFAEDNDAWIRSFVKAFDLMTAHGSDNLQDLIVE